MTTMESDGSTQPRKSWEELVAAASLETDPERQALMMEEILAALEKRQSASLGG